jgi:hypothetical protein
MWLRQRLLLHTGHFRLTSYLNKAARKWYVTRTMARNGSGPRNMNKNWPVIHSFFGGINWKRRPLNSLFATGTITSFHKALLFKTYLRSVYKISFFDWGFFLWQDGNDRSVYPVNDLSLFGYAGRSSAEIVGSNLTGGHGYFSVVSVVCCQVEVSATSWSLVQRSPTDCGAPLSVI